MIKKRYFIALCFTIGILYFTHHTWLGHKNSANFDFLLYIVISILGYLISLKITSYIANFSTIKNQSRIEILFLTTFFIVLLLPMSYINQEKISKSENRKLATWHKLIDKDGKFNYKFGKDFENWFNDRFALRKELIELNYIYKYFINDKLETEKMYYYKDSNVAFLKFHIPKEETFSKENIQPVVTELNKLNKFCNKHNIKLYVLIVPYNQYIYQQYAKAFANPEGLEKLNYNIKMLQDKSDANIIYVYEDLKKASEKDFVAFKTDHHWSEYGAFIGYQRIMKEIQKDFPNIKIAKETEFNIKKSKKVRSDFNRKFHEGETIIFNAPFLKPFSKIILDTSYKYYTHKDEKRLHIDTYNTSLKREKEYFYPRGSNYKLLEIGTSMNENLLQFTPYSFKQTKYIRINSVKDKPEEDEFKIMKYNKQNILDYKPNIMIFCITPVNLNKLKNIFKEDK